MNREQAKQELNKLSTASIMCAFDIIGRDYLNGETAFMNDLDGLYDLIDQFELAPNEIVGHMVGNQFYDNKDHYISFDGETLHSYGDLRYFKHMILKKMNGECAEFILNEPKVEKWVTIFIGKNKFIMMDY